MEAGELSFGEDDGWLTPAEEGGGAGEGRRAAGAAGSRRGPGGGPIGGAGPAGLPGEPAPGGAGSGPSLRGAPPALAPLAGLPGDGGGGLTEFESMYEGETEGEGTPRTPLDALPGGGRQWGPPTPLGGSLPLLQEGFAASPDPSPTEPPPEAGAFSEEPLSATPAEARWAPPGGVTPTSGEGTPGGVQWLSPEGDIGATPSPAGPGALLGAGGGEGLAATPIRSALEGATPGGSWGEPSMRTAGAVEPPPGRHPIHDLRGAEGSPAGGSNSAPATPLQGSQTPAGGGVRRFEPREFASPAAFRDRFEAGGLDGGFGSPSASAGRADESAQAQPGGGRAVEDPPWEARNSRAAEGGPEYAEGGVPASLRAEAQHPPRAEDPAQRQGADETAAGTPGDTPSTSSAYGAYRQRLRGTPGSSRRLLHQTSDVGELTTPSGSGSEGGDWGSEDIDSMTAKSAKARKKALRRAMRHKYEQKLRDGWGRRGGSEPEPEDFYRNGGSPSPDAAPRSARRRPSGSGLFHTGPEKLNSARGRLQGNDLRDSLPSKPSLQEVLAPLAGAQSAALLQQQQVLQQQVRDQQAFQHAQAIQHQQAQAQVQAQALQQQQQLMRQQALMQQAMMQQAMLQQTQAALTQNVTNAANPMLGSSFIGMPGMAGPLTTPAANILPYGAGAVGGGAPATAGLQRADSLGVNQLVGSVQSLALGGPEPVTPGKAQSNSSIPPETAKLAFKKVRNNKVDEVGALMDDGVPPDIRDESGNTLLAVACQNGHKRLTRAMLKRGADINAQNRRGQTPLHYCFAFGHLELGDYLISKGADDTVANCYGLTAYEGLVPEEPSPQAPAEA